MNDNEMNEWQLLDPEDWKQFLDYQEEWFEIIEEMNEF